MRHAQCDPVLNRQRHDSGVLCSLLHLVFSCMGFSLTTFFLSAGRVGTRDHRLIITCQGLDRSLLEAEPRAAVLSPRPLPFRFDFGPCPPGPDRSRFMHRESSLRIPVTSKHQSVCCLSDLILGPTGVGISPSIRTHTSH